jgi:serine/threonine-protein kinase
VSSPFKPVPERLGRFVVGATLARGGMARIHVGRSEDGEVVALKVIDPSLEHSQEFVSLFLDEGRVLSAIDHPNVVRTVEIGFDQAHYIAMELLRGHTLLETWEAILRGNAAMSWQLSAWVCARLAAGVQAAHDLQDPEGGGLRVIHRDVNPANVFLTFDGGVKLIDFGLAKAHGQRSKSSPGIVKGKLPYLAPEQAHNEHFDQRVDVFSIGVTLWECLTMRRLFRRETDVLTLQAVQVGEVPDPRMHAPDLPADLLAVLSKALATYPKDRYGSAAALERDLDLLLEERAFSEGSQTLARYLAELFPGDAREQESRAGRPRSMPDPDEVTHIQPTPPTAPVLPAPPSSKKAIARAEPDSAPHPEVTEPSAPSEPSPEPVVAKDGPDAGPDRSNRPVVTALVGAVALALMVWALSRLLAP